MIEQKKSVHILIAEDDDDDYLFAEKAIQELRLLNHVLRVKDGEELMQYLLNREPFEDAAAYPTPYLILLDLNMPRKDGREAIKEIKNHPKLKRIPVVILTTSKSEEDMLNAYNLGANSYIRKPVTLEQLVDVIKTLKHYWIDIVSLPNKT
jgi:CheY-like chemotaxis protein